jgi:o-succinylbenzoate synthase
MKITDVKLSRISIPLKTPFKTALRSTDRVNDILVCIETDSDLCGYGEAATTAVITGDTLGSMTAAISEYIAPAIIGRDLDDFDNIIYAVNKSILKNTSAKAAVDIALYDLFAKSCKKPLYKLLGKAKNSITTDVTISVNPVEEMVRDSVTAVNNGFSILKVKVGKGGLGDAITIEEIRKAVGKDVTIRVDANQGWEAKGAIRTIRAMEDKGLNIELVEQPLSAHDLDGMRFVTANVSTPILADESVFCAADAIEIIRTHAADIINIKLMKTGGICEALRVIAIAESLGVKCMVGCMMESHISVGAAAHLAAAKNVCVYADLDGPALLAENPYEGGPEFIGEKIIMTDSPGLGFTKVPL